MSVLRVHRSRRETKTCFFFVFFLRFATFLRLPHRQGFMWRGSSADTCRSAAAISSSYCLFAFLVIRPRCFSFPSHLTPCAVSRQHKQIPAAVIKTHWFNDMFSFWITQIRWHFMDNIGQKSTLVLYFVGVQFFFNCSAWNLYCQITERTPTSLMRIQMLTDWFNTADEFITAKTLISAT